MRLTQEQIAVIKQTTAEVFGPSAEVRLFGSRVDVQQRGGDIDLLVYCTQIIEDKLHKSLTLTARLQMRLGDQPIDVLVIDPSVPLKNIHHAALRTGQTLGTMPVPEIVVYSTQEVDQWDKDDKLTKAERKRILDRLQPG